MSVRDPGDLLPRILAALNAGDADALAALYEPGAMIVGDPSAPFRGREAIRGMAREFLATRPRCELHESEVIVAEDLALLRSSWTITRGGNAGDPEVMTIRPMLVARRQPDGAWLVVIDRPLPRE